MAPDDTVHPQPPTIVQKVTQLVHTRARAACPPLCQHLSLWLSPQLLFLLGVSPHQAALGRHLAATDSL